MHLSDPTRKSLRSALPDSWETLERIRITLLLSEKEMAERLDLTLKSYYKARAARKPLNAHNIFSLCESLGIGFAPVMQGNLDFKALAKHYFGDRDFLPEKYKQAAFSKRRTTLFILNHIEKNFGWQERALILKNFQLNESIFLHPESMINFHFASDLCDYLLKYKYGEMGMSNIGVESLLSTNLDHVKKELIESRNMGELFVKMAEDLIPKYFEKNFIYQISNITKKGCVITASPNSDVMDQLNSRLVGNHATALVKQGIAAAWPRIIGLPAANVRQIACIYRGDPAIKYDVNYEQSAHLLGRKRSMN